MATKILLKKSSTAGAVPLTTDLEIGEVALNLADRKLYTKNNSSVVVPIGGAYVGTSAPSAPAEGDLWYDSTNDLLKTFNGTVWVEAGTATTLATLGLTATATELNYVDGVTSSIQTQLDGKASTAHNHTIDGLSNVTITANSDNEVLAWDNATSRWINQTAAEAGLAASNHNHTLDSLSNVTITANASGEILKWNGTAWVNNTLAEAGIQPTGSYLTAEADTLSSVTGRGATTATAVSITNATASTTTGTGALVVTGGVGIGGAVYIGGATTIAGNLTVNGTTTSVNSNEVNIGDAIIILNADETAAPTQNAGIEIERGTLTNVSLLWDEAADTWTFGDQIVAGIKLDGGTY